MRLFTSTLGSLGRLSSRPFLRPHIPQPRPVVLQPRCQFASGPVGFPRPRMRSNEYKRFGNQAPFYMSKRLWVFTGTATVLFGGYYVTHLEQVPLSGRYRFMDVTPGQEKAMAQQAYQEVIAQYGRKVLPSHHPYTLFVRRVAQRIVHAAGMDHLQWEFHVIDSPERNAFVLPGGKVFVFTGILPIVENEDGMAAVLGHEIAHQFARHSAEKLSFSKIVLALQLTLWLFGIDPAFLANQLALNFVILKPFSRKCEVEADEIGLQLMAQACFNPQEAVALWQRMETAGGSGPPQFVSTHPSHKNRVEFLEKEMPKALAKRADSNCSSEIGVMADQFHTLGQRLRW